MNIVMISNYSRPEIVKQSMLSLMHNASDWSKHHFTLVWNGLPKTMTSVSIVGEGENATTIMVGNVGASRARNVGASSIPKYLRHENICFFDDDIYAVKGWDRHIEETINDLGDPVSGSSHPYNSTYFGTGVTKSGFGWKTTSVLSTVNIACEWRVFDHVGPWCEPGGPGGSEDVEWCARAVKTNYRLALTEPQVILHTGIHSSNGTPIVGSEMVMERNRELERVHGIVGKVRYS